MTFSIGFVGDRTVIDDYNETTLEGAIVIESFEERFFAPVSYWQPADYQRQWKEALRRILTDAETSCLITALRDPASANFLVWWPMYRVDEIIFVQNQLLFLESLPGGFTVQNPFQHIHPRQRVNRHGQGISEWPVPVSHVR